MYRTTIFAYDLAETIYDIRYTHGLYILVRHSTSGWWNRPVYELCEKVVQKRKETVPFERFDRIFTTPTDHEQEDYWFRKTMSILTAKNVNMQKVKIERGNGFNIYYYAFNDATANKKITIDELVKLVTRSDEFLRNAPSLEKLSIDVLKTHDMMNLIQIDWLKRYHELQPI